jgi:hypothetical protein
MAMFERLKRQRVFLEKEKLDEGIEKLATGMTVRLLGQLATICRLKDPLIQEIAEEWEKEIRERVYAMLVRVRED